MNDTLRWGSETDSVAVSALGRIRLSTFSFKFLALQTHRESVSLLGPDRAAEVCGV